MQGKSLPPGRLIKAININHKIKLLFSFAKKDKACPVRLLNTGKNNNASPIETISAQRLMIIVSIKNW